MLVFNRKEGESFTIDGQIKIKILGGGTARIGIQAPRSIKIVRDESPSEHCNNKKYNKA